MLRVVRSSRTAFSQILFFTNIFLCYQQGYPHVFHSHFYDVVLAVFHFLSIHIFVHIVDNIIHFSYFRVVAFIHIFYFLWISLLSIRICSISYSQFNVTYLLFFVDKFSYPHVLPTYPLFYVENFSIKKAKITWPLYFTEIIFFES
jgi:hypothetical protein